MLGFIKRNFRQLILVILLVVGFIGFTASMKTNNELYKAYISSKELNYELLELTKQHNEILAKLFEDLSKKE